MSWGFLAGLLPGGQTLTKVATVFTILATLSGGAVWLYKAVKAQGAAEVRVQLAEANLAQLRRSTGEAIAELNRRHAAQNAAAAARQAAGEQAQSSATATISELQKELQHARQTDKCVDKLLPDSRVKRLRGLSQN